MMVMLGNAVAPNQSSSSPDSLYVHCSCLNTVTGKLQHIEKL